MKSKLYIENRIAKLSRDYMGNIRLIKKWERKLRKLESEEA